MQSALHPVQIAPVTKTHAPLGLGCYTFGAEQWTGEQDANLLAAMETALDSGMNHFDTAADYGNGYSERLIGKFMKGRREAIFLATKNATDDIRAEKMLELVQQSLSRLQTDYIDLFY